MEENKDHTDKEKDTDLAESVLTLEIAKALREVLSMRKGLIKPLTLKDIQ